jgi:hypothetical protein
MQIQPQLVADHTMSSLTASAVAVWIIQYLKGAKWFPLLQAHTKGASRLASIILAALGTAGLQWQWTSSTHTLAISNLTLMVILTGLWHVLQHFAVQEVVYQAAVNKPVPEKAENG